MKEFYVAKNSLLMGAAMGPGKDFSFRGFPCGQAEAMGTLTVTVSSVSSVAGDPHWDKVVALLHFDENLVDETGRTWSGVGTPTYSGGGVAGSYGLTGVCTTSYDSNLDVPNEDFTIEFFVKASDWTSWSRYTSKNPVAKYIPVSFGKMVSPEVINHWSFGPMRDGKLAFYAYNNNSHIYYLSTTTLPKNTLVHVVLMRNSGRCLMAIDGIIEDVGTFPSINLGASCPFSVGSYNNVTRAGIQDELRITKGVARYTENFTPPTAPFPNF